MKKLIARTPDGTYGVIIGVNTLKQIGLFCSAAGDCETGGIIIGRYSSDLSNALVLEATPPPPDSKRGHSYFIRGVSGLTALLQERWASNQRTYYLGEWHFHPSVFTKPSQDDLYQMRQIAGAKEYSCKEPLLLVFGRTPNVGLDRPAIIYVCPMNELPMKMRRVK